MKLILSSLFLSLSLIASAQNCPCCTPAHEAFDFWVGEWEVRDTSGTIVGTNTIIKNTGGCLLTEHWQGSTGGDGRSINFYNPVDSTWNQQWVSSNGYLLSLQGGLSADGKSMILKSPLVKNPQGQEVQHHVSWTPHEDGSVIQHWKILDKNGAFIADAFYGIYTRKP